MAEIKSSDNVNESNLPWYLGIFDAHCHPTDTIGSLDSIADMKASGLVIMATREEDQEVVRRAADKIGIWQPSGCGPLTQSKPEQCNKLVPSFGWHPWFSHQIYDDVPSEAKPVVGRADKHLHYGAVLSPAPDNDFIDSLPQPQPLSQVLAQIKRSANQYNCALIGEIGLDRSFRLPVPWNSADEDARDPKLTPGGREGRRLSPYRVRLDHQRMLLKAQLNLAGELQRAVSVHGVAAHGVVLETLQETWRGHEQKFQSKRKQKEAAKAISVNKLEDDAGLAVAEHGSKSHGSPVSKPYPPRVCLHSYSGPPDSLKQYLDPSVPATVFFSFSILVNFRSTSSKAVDVVRAVPDNRLLIESDLHSAGEEMDDLLEQVVRIVCDIKKWPLGTGVKQLASNWKDFVFG
ncbi:MAG: hypothetical protein Q9190_005967 [Brigantiaea leucoxantha]